MSKRLFDMYNVIMKKRDYKNFAQGSMAHIFNRGNNKEKIFFDEQDYKAFLFRIALALGFSEKELLSERTLTMPYSRIRIEGIKNLFVIHAFCLMPNHFHIIIEQLGNVPISNLISKVCTSYAKYINKKYKKVGHVFQDCFKATLIEDDEQLMWVSAYIHMNPVKDKLVSHPSKYKWSSYNHLTGGDNLILCSKFLKEKLGEKSNFEKETLNYYVKESL